MSLKAPRLMNFGRALLDNPKFHERNENSPSGELNSHPAQGRMRSGASSWPPKLRNFCATLLSAHRHCATFQRWVDARKSLISLTPVQLSTNQGVVGSNPASR